MIDRSANDVNVIEEGTERVDVPGEPNGSCFHVLAEEED